MRTSRRLSVLVAGLLGCAACSAGVDESGSLPPNSATPAVVVPSEPAVTVPADVEAAEDLVIHASDAQDFSFEGVDSWVSWADQVAVVTVTSERDGESANPVERDDLESFEQLLTMRIDETLWSADERRTATGVIDVQGAGFVEIDGERYRVDNGGALLRPGGTYLVALIDAARTGDSWQLFSPDSNFAMEAGVVVESGEAAAARSGLVGLSITEVASRVAAAEPLPGVDPSIESLAERLQAFLATRDTD